MRILTASQNLENAYITSRYIPVEFEELEVRNMLEIARKIKELLKKEVGSVRVFVFGSVVEGKHTPSSDIDVLAVSKNMPKGMKRSELRAKVLREISVFYLFRVTLF